MRINRKIRHRVYDGTGNPGGCSRGASKYREDISSVYLVRRGELY